jgi:hypothetical protein
MWTRPCVRSMGMPSRGPIRGSGQLRCWLPAAATTSPCHRPGRDTGPAGCRSPPPCGDGARHPRPQARRRAAALPLGQVPGQRRVAGHHYLAHNLLRWVATLGLGHRGLVAAKTLRCRLIALPGRLTRSARRSRLHLPQRWPWTSDFSQALGRLRAITTSPPLPVGMLR